MAADPVSEVRERIEIVDLVSRNVQLKRTGRNFKGLCPFHQEKTPSFVVFPETQNFHCFGCGKGGDVFTYFMDTEGLEFGEALRTLADEVGVSLETGPALARPKKDEHAHIVEALQMTAEYYAKVLLDTKQGEIGRTYLSGRGVSDDIIRQFGLGMAPDGWDYLLRQLSARGIGTGTGVEAGLLQTRDDGGHYDRFRNRLMFPIHDRDGSIVGFGGRAFDDETQPKYLNSPQSLMFDKSALLYGLHLAKDAIRKQDEVVIVEGYMDALAAHQFGFDNVVAAMGTALTENQVDLVKRLTRRIVLALDADSAGQMASLRAIESLHQALDYDEEVVPVTSTFLRIARRLDAEVGIVQLPGDDDPDTIIRRQPDEWPAIVKGRKPYIEFLLQKSAAEIDMSDASEKRRAVDKLASVIQRIPDSLERSHYVERIGRVFGFPYTEVQSRVQRVASRQRRNGRASRPVSPGGRYRVSAEDHLVAMFLHFGRVVEEFLDSVSPDDLADARNRTILESLRLSRETGDESTELIEALDPQIAEHVVRVQEHLQNRPGQVPAAVREELLQTLLKLQRDRLEDLSAYLREEISLAIGHQDTAEYDALVQRLHELPTMHRQLYPKQSPFFRDSRSPAENRPRRKRQAKLLTTDSTSSESSSGNTERKSSLI